ncbi:Aromatic amino acid lyase [Carpediemonas membranifera]|uniref:Histidine ammonia-lyase n=1 Tax=Carpediemonas membranifera TaxID=201153 RepID=A0A8J6APG5_9EUKA|nr:Aromatic amino acid lyase [Carpediemonas membranifera]|eukprot:KAG9389896.1 Aromatic amino acid lyase [Carpediemonas membranifera]
MTLYNRKTTLELDGYSLTPEDLYSLRTGDIKISITDEAMARVKEARGVVDRIVENDEVVYGITTGFGLFSNVRIPNDKLAELQENLIRSHAAGVGEPLSPERTRMLLAIRINVIAKGHSGARPETLLTMVECFNHGCLSWVPEQGTVGASGDLAPLSHLALGMMGEGKMFDAATGQYGDAGKILASHGITPIALKAKEGLALINGTQLISTFTTEAYCRAANLITVADIAVAMSLEALQGTKVAFDPRIHAARPHEGQQASARRIREFLRDHVDPNGDSQICVGHRNCGRVQDAYSLRCSPQVHGQAHDALKYVRGILMTELNSATDNPMVFGPSFCDEAHPNGQILSGGNFHGEYPAKAADFLAIAVHELANISERRVERMCNPSLSNGLPAFLVKEGGLNSGFMIAHCTTAALVSENKSLCHPASVDSISTSAAKEDHVSMGGYAARKAAKVVENVERSLAIEILAACQGIQFHLDEGKKSSEALMAVHAAVREVAKPWDKDRAMSPDIDAVWELVRDGMIVDVTRPFVE